MARRRSTDPRRRRTTPRAGVVAGVLLSMMMLLAQLGSLAARAETRGHELSFDGELEMPATPDEPDGVRPPAAVAHPDEPVDTPSAPVAPAAPGGPACDRDDAGRARTLTACTPTLTIAKTANVAGSRVASGSAFTYTVTVANAGKAPATGVEIMDSLPVGLASPSATFSVSGGAAQPCAFAGNDMTCTVGTLVSGASAVVTIAVTAPRVCGTLSNTATVEADLTSPLGSSPAVVAVSGCGLAIKKVATPSTVSPGGTVTYTIEVRNVDVAPASAAVVTDTIPTGYTVVSATADVDPSGPPTPAPCGISGQSVTCALGLLAPAGDSSADDRATIGIVVTAPATCGSAFNRATVRWGLAGQATSNSAKTTVAGCGLVVDKQGPASVLLGGALTYSITVTNPGPGATSQPVTVDDIVPAALTNMQAAAARGGAPIVPNPCSVAGNAVSCALGVLPPGDTVVVTIDAAAPTNACPTVTNTATVAVGTQLAQQTPTVTTIVTGCAPSVTLDKAGPGQVAAGGSIAYTLTVANTATADADAVVVNDTVPAPLTNVSASPSTGTCTVNGNDVACAIGTLAPGQDETITITADVPPGACGVIENSATGTFTGGSVQSGLVQTSMGSCGPTVAPALAIVKTADAGVVAPGQPIGFTITVRNDGTADATDVAISDSIPAVPGVTWSIDGGAAAGSCSLLGTSLHCALGTLAAGEVRTVHVSATPTTTQSCGTYTNFAIAASTNAQAARARADVSVDCPPGIDIVKDGPAFAYVGDTVTYTFDVSLIAGSPPLTDVQVDDPTCDPGTLRLVSRDGGDQDATLEQGETWRYDCTHLVTAGDPDPLPNTATAIGIGPGGPVSDNDDHLIDIRHPDIELVKEADPPAGAPGAAITYTYTVTNSGDVPLHDLSVDDDILGHVCDVPVLRTGETVVCIGTYTIPAGANVSITNIAIAGGTDPGERYVSDEDDETIDVVLGTTITPAPTRTPPTGLAFTGAGIAVTLTAIGIALLVIGFGLLWVGYRLRRSSRA